MKRELAFALEVHSQCGLIGRTRSTKAQTQNETINCNGVAWNESNKKLKTLNDELEGNDSSDRIRETKNRWDGVIQYSRNKRLKRLEESKNDERRTIAEEPKDDESTTDEEQKTDENDPVVVEKPTGGYLVGPICEEEPKSQSQKASIKDESNDGSLKLQTAGLIDESKEIDIAMEEKLPKRFTRSALKSKEDTVESLESDYNFCNSVAIGVDEKTNGAVRSLTSPKKLGLKMSKKIALNKVPLTIRDLLETGMLEGYPVTYDGRKKGYRLQGTIKGNGILCSCSLCKGSRVVLPSQFELHACKSYRHAAKYIYLDNGKNLHDVLHVCKDAPLETLEATIQSAIGSFPVKRSLPADEAAKMDPLGNSCIKRNNSPATSIHRTSERARLLKPIPVTKSSGSALYNSSENKSLGKITKKDQRLHRLVFEEGGLPDGTEVAYYAGGKKLLDGYKKGFGIFCWCCHCEVSASQFEAHAGWASRKKPYSYIYTSNGVSLHELAISLSKGPDAMDTTSSQPSNSNQTASEASKYLVNLPSRGLFSSTVISSNPGGMRVYICDHETSPPEEQLIKTNQTNILIRSLTLKKQKGDSSSKDVKGTTAAEVSKKRTAERALDSRSSSKRAMTNAQSSSRREGSGSSTRTSDRDYQSLTVERLRALLKERGLSPKGKKDELIARLKSVNG